MATCDSCSAFQQKLPGVEGGLLPSDVAVICGPINSVIAGDEDEVVVDAWAVQVNVGVGDVRDHALGLGNLCEATVALTSSPSRRPCLISLAVRLRDARPLVLLANAVARRWPVGRALEYVHAPFAAGEQPASLDPAFYRPLRKLALPEETRFIAGLLHEGRDLDEQRHVLAMVEDQVGRPVDLGAACGLGRRTPEQAAAAMDQASALIDTSRSTGEPGSRSGPGC